MFKLIKKIFLIKIKISKLYRANIWSFISSVFLLNVKHMYIWVITNNMNITESNETRKILKEKCNT
jgi:hypothetical protein